MEGLAKPLLHDICLKRFAMTALIANLFEDSITKEKIKEVIRTKYNRSIRFPFEALKEEINKLTFKKLEELNLSKELMPETEGILIIFTKKIIAWAEYIIKILKFDLSYIDDIYWTSLGTIDEAKIFDKYWRKHGNLSKFLTNDHENREMVPELACDYANEEIILSCQNKLIKEVIKFLKNVKVSSIKNKVEKLAAIYICYSYGEGYDLMMEKNVYSRFKQTGKVNISEIIFICADQGLSQAMKFFWKYLDNTEKQNIMAKLAFYSLHGHLSSSYMTSDPRLPDLYEKYKHYDEIESARGAEMVHFLLNQMSLEQRNKFLKENIGGIVKLFLLVWPYQELLLKILDLKSVEQWMSEINDDNGEDVLYAPLYRMIKDGLSDSCVYQNIFHEVLRKVMKIVPRYQKTKRLFDQMHYEFEDIEDLEVIEVFYDRFDVVALSIIINDKDLEEERDMMLSMGRDKILELKRDGKIESLISFMENVLISNGERKKFIKQYGLADDILKSDNPDIKDKVLRWVIV